MLIYEQPFTQKVKMVRCNIVDLKAPNKLKKSIINTGTFDPFLNLFRNYVRTKTYFVLPSLSIQYHRIVT
jgi:hypothetical protein